MAVCALIAPIGGAVPLAHAVAPAATTTTLAITSGGKAATSVASGTVVTLTAAVTAGSTKVTTGLVSFCDASVSYCTDIHLIGTAQLTGSGKATLSTLASIGTHHFKAVFAGTMTNSGSTSTASALSVSGLQPTVTAIATSEDGETGLPQTATVGSAGMVAPSGEVSFLNASEDDTVLATATLGAGTAGLMLLPASNLDLPITAYQSRISAVAADFNGDGLLDIAATGNADGEFDNAAVVTVALGDGKGGFTPAPSATLGDTSYRVPIAVGDFNGDGKPDVVVAALIKTSTTPVLMVLLGNGDGTFRAGQTIPMGQGITALAVADVNGDGSADIAATQGLPSVIMFYLGNGDGTFTASAGAPISVPDSPEAMVAGDFNGDGVTDLAVATDPGNDSPGMVAILLGRGDGTFTQAAGIEVGIGSDAIAAGDFNGDGKLDLTVANTLSFGVSVLLGNGDGTFTPAKGSPIAVVPDTIGIGDFDGDGKLDIAYGNDPSGQGVGLLLGNGDGTFNPGVVPLVFPNGSQSSEPIPLGDFNGDGLTDLAVHIAAVMAATQTASATSDSVAATPGTGSQLIAANYAGDSAFFASGSATVSLDAAPAVPTVDLTASPKQAAQGASVTLTATLTASGNLPTGTVIFSNGSTSLGTGTLNASGVATYSTTKLPVGADAITASYDGDQYNSGSNSTPVTITVTAPALIATVPTPAAVTPGLTATAAATFTASSTYAGSLNLSCSLMASPTGAQSVPACSLSPTSLTLAAGATGTSVLSVTTTAASMTASWSAPSRESLWGLGGRGPVLAVLLLCGIPARRRRWLSMLMLLWVVVACAAIGCGGAGSGVPPKGISIPATTAGNYTFTVTGTDSKDSTVTTSARVVVTVN